MPTPATTTKRSEGMIQSSAPTLQRGPSMMVRVVGILAVGLMSACGVGVEAEDPEGQEAATSRASLQMACAELGTCPEAAVPPRAPVSPVAMPGTVGLPQDPIPWRPPVAATERPFGPNGLPDTGVPPRR
jgi:hypothetical protein